MLASMLRLQLTSNVRNKLGDDLRRVRIPLDPMAVCQGMLLISVMLFAEVKLGTWHQSI